MCVCVCMCICVCVYSFIGVDSLTENTRIASQLTSTLFLRTIEGGTDLR